MHSCRAGAIRIESPGPFHSLGAYQKVVLASRYCRMIARSPAVRQSPQDPVIRARLASVYLQLGDAAAAKSEACAVRERDRDQGGHFNATSVSFGNGLTGGITSDQVLFNLTLSPSDPNYASDYTNLAGGPTLTTLSMHPPTPRRSEHFWIPPGIFRSITPCSTRAHLWR